MATHLMNAHNIIGSCCGSGGLLSKIKNPFHKDDEQEQSTPAAQNAAPSSAGAGTKPSAAKPSAAKPIGAKKFGFTDKQVRTEITLRKLCSHVPF